MRRDLKPQEKDLLYRVVNRPDLQSFFFRKARGLHWYAALEECGFFSPEKNPTPVPANEVGYVIVPFWPAMDYLVNTSEELSDPNNKEYAIKYIELIRSLTIYAKNSSFSNYRTWWQLAKIIAQIPTQLILIGDIDLVDYWMNDPFDSELVTEEVGEKWLIKLLGQGDEHSQTLALQLLDCLFKLNYVQKRTGSYEKNEYVLRFDSYHAGILEKKEVAKLSGLKLGLPALEIFQKQLALILNENNHDTWSSIWRKAIEEHEQNAKHKDADDILVAAYRDCLLGFVECNAPAATCYIRTLFDGQYQTFQRVAIYVIDKQYTELKELVHSVLLRPEYFQANYRHEMWHFLNNHYRELDADQQNIVVKIIEGLRVTEDDVVNEKATAYKRAIWLSAIKDFDENLAGLYRNYTSVAGSEPAHPDFSSYMTVGWVGHKSPIPIEYLLSLNANELAQAINSYKEVDRKGFDEPGLEGLVKAFKEVIKTKAKIIYPDLSKFANCKLEFIYPLIDAYCELWSEKNELPWNDVWPNLINFCFALVKKDEFWLQVKEGTHFVANRDWIVGAIGQLLEDGTKSDEHAFDKSLLARAKDILFALLERQEGAEFKLDSDAVSVAINSPRGRCLKGLINLTLRSCRLEHKEHGNHTEAWSQYKDMYESELKRDAECEYEFTTLVSMFLPNFNYMSNEWVKAHLSEIFDQSNYQKWLCAMQGYSYIGTVYEIFYKHLKVNGHFLKALDNEHIKKQVCERIIESIAVAYINDFEKLKQADSLIAILLQRKKIDELNLLIRFIWTLYDKKNAKLREKVYELWPHLLNITDVNAKEGRLLASSLCLWVVFVEEIDPNIEAWLFKIAPYAAENHNAFDLVQNLATISDSQPIAAQKIWIKMLESYSHDYPEESIRRIFKNLLALGYEGEKKAIEVVNAYLKYGLDRPRMWFAEIKAAQKNN